MLKIKYQVGDHIILLPALRVVCSRCDGEGTILNPSIGEHAYSREEFEEAFPEPEDQEQYFKRGGIYDIVCPDCKGKNVVDEVHWNELARRSPRLHARICAQVEAEYEYERECEAERRFGC